ncbi:MAG: SIMPL domain-containing protein [Candidatus Obscuribacterales bacterium]|nr:SIMPL domain-containing protein [Candidatus Obscuribacterales bacterium]
MTAFQLSHPDIITVEESFYEEVIATGARVQLTVKGTSFISGNAAFKKAREVATIVDALKSTGIEESDLKLTSVRGEVNAGVLTKFSSVNYSVEVHCKNLDKLGDVLAAIANAKSATLEGLKWDYPENQDDKDRWLRTALARAISRAEVMADSLGVRLGGVYESVSAFWNEWNHEANQGSRSNMPGMKMLSRAREETVGLGFALTGSEKRGVSVRVDFKIQG